MVHDVVTLSDHALISFSLSPEGMPWRRQTRTAGQAWDPRKIDEDMLIPKLWWPTNVAHAPDFPCVSELEVVRAISLMRSGASRLEAHEWQPSAPNPTMPLD